MEIFANLGTGFAGFAGLIGLLIACIHLRGIKKSLNHSNLMSIFEIEFELNKRKERIATIRQKCLEIIKERDENQLSADEKIV